MYLTTDRPRRVPDGHVVITVLTWPLLATDIRERVFISGAGDYLVNGTVNPRFLQLPGSLRSRDRPADSGHGPDRAPAPSAHAAKGKGKKASSGDSGPYDPARYK